MHGANMKIVGRQLAAVVQVMWKLNFVQNSEKLFRCKTFSY